MYCSFLSVRVRNIKHSHITVQPSPPYVWLMKLSPMKQLPPPLFQVLVAATLSSTLTVAKPP